MKMFVVKESYTEPVNRQPNFKFGLFSFSAQNFTLPRTLIANTIRRYRLADQSERKHYPLSITNPVVQRLHTFKTIIQRAHVGHEMIDTQHGA